MTQEKQRLKRIYARLTEQEYADVLEQADAVAFSRSEYLARTSPFLKYGLRFTLDLGTLIGLGFSLCSCTANLSSIFCL